MQTKTYLCDADHAVLSVGPVLIQIRFGELTFEVIDRVASYGGLVRAANRGRLGFLAILEPGAPTPPIEVQEHQRAVITRFSERRVAPIAIVNIEQGVQTVVQRVRSRDYKRQGASILIAEDLHDAARWLAAELELADPGVILTAAEQGREERRAAERA